MPYVEYDEVEAACADCGRLFRSEEALREHQAGSHEQDAAAPAHRVNCSLCARTFPSAGTLAEHNRRVHTG